MRRACLHYCPLDHSQAEPRTNHFWWPVPIRRSARRRRTGKGPGAKAGKQSSCHSSAKLHKHIIFAKARRPIFSLYCASLGPAESSREASQAELPEFALRFFNHRPDCGSKLGPSPLVISWPYSTLFCVLQIRLGNRKRSSFCSIPYIAHLAVSSPAGTSACIS